MLRTLIHWFDTMARVDRSRRALARLSEDQLRDIGISARDAHIETLRPQKFAQGIWRVN